MWPVSDRFLNTIARTHKVTTACTLTLPGTSPVPLTLAGGSVTSDRTQRIRRTAPVTIRGGSTVYDQLSTPGARIAIQHGFLWGGTDTETVPMIVGELSQAARQAGDGLIQASVADLWQVIAASDYLTPYTPSPTATRTAVIVAAVLDALPGTTIVNMASDTGTVGTSQAWTSRADMINSLATDGGMDAYFAPDGSFTLRDSPKLTDPVAWLVRAGDGGTLTDLSSTRALGQVFNTVILEPGTADATQTWTQVIAQVTDPTSPIYPGTIGVRPYPRYQSPTALTVDQATTVAQQLLFKVQGSTETLTLGALANPALEGGDIIRVTVPVDSGYTVVSHYLDTVTTDLASGAMSCGTRASSGLPT